MVLIQIRHVKNLKYLTILEIPTKILEYTEKMPTTIPKYPRKFLKNQDSIEESPRP